MFKCEANTENQLNSLPREKSKNANAAHCTISNKYSGRERESKRWREEERDRERNAKLMAN